VFLPSLPKGVTGKILFGGARRSLDGRSLGWIAVLGRGTFSGRGTGVLARGSAAARLAGGLYNSEHRSSGCCLPDCNGVGIATSRVFEPTEINTGGFIPSSRRRLCRHHRHHLLRRCPRLALRLLPRLALVEGGYRKVPSGQKSLSRGLLMSNGTPRSLWQRSDKGQRTERQAAPTSRLLWCQCRRRFLA